MMLKRIDVPKGKKKMKFSFLIRISPGNLPKTGILGQKKKIIPVKIRKMPRKIKNFPKK